MPATAISPRCISEDSKYNKISVKCRFCSSESVVKRGWRATKNRGKQQRWLCNNCNKSFTLDLGFWKMKNNENLVTQSIDQYFQNLSSRVVQRNLNQYNETKASHQSVLNWVRKYAEKLSTFINTLNPKLSGEFCVDETIIKCKRKEGIFWAGIDGQTKYITSSFYTLKPQNVDDAKRLLSILKATKQTKYIQTDSRAQYPIAIKKLFGLKGRGKQLSVEHRKINTMKTGKYNVKIERFFRNLKERTKLMYGFKSYSSASLILEGYRIWYNFIRPHMSLRTTPAIASGLELGLGYNKLWGLIVLSSINKNPR